MFVAVSLLLAAACLIPAAGKLAGLPKMRRSASHFGIAWRHYRLIGFGELAAAASILIGLFWRPAGLALLVALIAHLRAHDSVREALPAVLVLAVSGMYLAAVL